VKIFYDTEFIDDGRTIDLISIGMVAEDGREYYAVSSEFDRKQLAASEWLMANVWPSLPQVRGDARMMALASIREGSPPIKYVRSLFADGDPCVKSRRQIATDVRNFICSPYSQNDKAELWAWYGAYDHVALAQLWGPMVGQPRGVPMWTNDLKQEAQRLGNPRVPEQAEGQHNALQDARHNRRIAEFLAEVAAR
jgi:hypothetical protein